MKKLIVASMLTLFTLPVLADDTAKSFTEVDQNQDGVLNTQEAMAAMPAIRFVDANQDGIVNKSEAEAALPGLDLQTEDDSNASDAVGSADYELIVQAAEKHNENSTASIRNLDIDR